ncbi:hypothetical protein D3C80_1413120 [compost metagenome]
MLVIGTEQRRVAVEVQSAVHAKDRYIAIHGAVIAAVGAWIRALQLDCAGFAFTVQVEIVLGVGILQLGCDETVAGCHRVADGRRDVQTCSVGAFNTLDVLIKPATGCPGREVRVAIFV